VRREVGLIVCCLYTLLRVRYWVVGWVISIQDFVGGMWVERASICAGGAPGYVGCRDKTVVRREP
jgi:hypothetical protein